MSAATASACAVLLGAALAAGVILLAGRVPRWSAPSLQRRVAPYLRDIADPVGLTPLRAVRSGGGGLLGDRLSVLSTVPVLSALGGGAPHVAMRLRQAGLGTDVVAFRTIQVAWAVGGLFLGGLLAVLSVTVGRGGPLSVLLSPLCAVAAVAVCERRVTVRARRRTGRMEEELPTVLEFLSLCLSAGESLRDALRRVGEVGSGVLPGELRRAVLASGTGSTLADALLAVAKDAGVPALSRSVEHLVAAIDRGAPLAQVLQDQAVDAREDAKRALLEAAGRKEIFMLLPLVFLILPLSVLFAVFPGIVMLKLGIG